jgi:O-antigen/teichoic acid export membrane protein
MRYLNEENLYKKTLIHYIPAVLIPAFTNILLSLGLARILNVELYGTYTYLLSIGTLITSIISQWLVQSIQKFHYSEKNDVIYQATINFFKSIIVHIYIITLFVWMLNGVFINFIDNIINVILSLFMFFTAQSLLAIKVAIYSAEYKANLVKRMNIKQAILKLVLISIYLILFSEYKINVILFMISWANFYTVLTDMLKNKEIRNLILSNSIQKIILNKKVRMQIKKLLAYGLPMTGWFIGTNLLGVGDRIILKLYTDSSQVGIYSANYMLVSTGIGLLVSPLLQSAHPIIMNYGQKNIRSANDISIFIEKMSRKFITISLAVVVFLFFYYKEISLLFFGEDYQSGAFVIPITTLGIFFWNYSMYGHKGLELVGNTVKMMKYVLYSAVINMFLNIILIPNIGLNGAAVATLIAYISYAIMIKVDSKNNIKWIINYKYICLKIILYVFILILLKPIIDYLLNFFIKLINTQLK